ncbi:MAG: hypothetical protein IIC02_10785, partial [Planctomycetes bacterium]|nr:hypothetical protein [Planctomycetota bacterium]
WRFRSNHPLGQNFIGCDGGFSLQYRDVADAVNIYGDAVISFEGGDFVTGLDMNEFHTHRFESLNGTAFRFSVDGDAFFESQDASPAGTSLIQLIGRGGHEPPRSHSWY